ncbi:MAG: response regulator, partial [Deltaproteobacteria bacterium]
KKTMIQDKTSPDAGLFSIEEMRFGTCIRTIQLLVVEDDPVLLELIGRFFAQRDIETDLAANGREALEKLSSQSYDIVFTDLHIPVMDGLSLLEWIKKMHPYTRVVVISGDSTPESIIMAMRSGALDYLLKPFHLSDLLEVAKRCSRKFEPATQTSLISLVRQLSQDLSGDLVNLTIMAKLLEQGHYGHMETAVAEQLSKIGGKMRSMIAMVEDYSKIAVLLGQGRISSEEELDLKRDVISPILSELAMEISRKEIRITSNADQKTFEQATIKGNRMLLRNAFRSLLRVALKHCKEEGNISFGISYNGRRFMVNVSDDGPALPEKQRQSLFDDHLFLADPAGRAAEDDLGAGLFLARNIFRQHGGDLWYEGLDCDSKFILTLPANS